jgi:hypothetical protein
MTYLPTMGSIDAGSFNATKFPGMVYATNPTTHAVFMEMQKQLNRAAYAIKSNARLAIDGMIGSRTLALALAVGPYTPYSSPTSAAALAAMADVVSTGARSRADSNEVPQTVPAPKPPTPPAIIDPVTLTLKPAPAASITDAFKKMSMPMMLGLGAVAIGIGYFVLAKPKAK